MSSQKPTRLVQFVGPNNAHSGCWSRRTIWWVEQEEGTRLQTSFNSADDVTITFTQGGNVTSVVNASLNFYRDTLCVRRWNPTSSTTTNP